MLPTYSTPLHGVTGSDILSISISRLIIAEFLLETPRQNPSYVSKAENGISKVVTSILNNLSRSSKLASP